MTAEVITFTGITRLDLPADRVLKRAIEAGLSEVVITGFNADGTEYFASSVAAGGSVLWHLERAKTKLLAIPDQD